MSRLWTAIKHKSLWIMSIGLMAASSGIDGAYMAAWMPDNVPWLGYVLNTTSDVASEVLMFWFARLQQERKGTKKWRLSWAILPAEAVIVLFSWFFGWRQLRLVMPRIEGASAVWVAPVSAAFVPLLLVTSGYAQALLAGKFENASQSTASASQSTASAMQSADTYTAQCEQCGWSSNGHESSARAERALRVHQSRWCKGEG